MVTRYIYYYIVSKLMFSAGIIFFFIGYNLSAVINNQIHV